MIGGVGELGLERWEEQGWVYTGLPDPAENQAKALKRHLAEKEFDGFYKYERMLNY